MAVKACLNGGRTREEHPAVPHTPQELAADAITVRRAGAFGVHVHPRDARGAQTLDPAACDAAVAAVRNAVPGLPVGLTTLEAIQPDPFARAAAVAAWRQKPDFVSVNISELGWAGVARAAFHAGIGIEAGLATPADAEEFARSSFVHQVLRALVEVEGGADDALAVSQLVPEGVRQLWHGYGPLTWEVIAAGAAAGHDVRVGLEDVLVLPDGSVAAGNAELVEAASAKLLASLGFEALATTSSGFAATLGRVDNSVTREEGLAHSAAIVAATPLPVSADLENGFADDAEGVAETVRGAVDAGLAGCSIEDSTGREDEPLYAVEHAAERVAAAAEAAGGRLVLTGRAENFIVGRPDLSDTIARLQAYQEAGADVLYAPRLTSIEDIRSVVESVDRPVNVLAFTGLPPVSELAAAGVSRVSVGGWFAFSALGALVEAATELRERGTYGYIDAARGGAAAAVRAFASESGS